MRVLVLFLFNNLFFSVFFFFFREQFFSSSVAAMPPGPHMRVMASAKSARGETPNRGESAGEPDGGVTLSTDYNDPNTENNTETKDEIEPSTETGQEMGANNASTAVDEPQDFLVHCRGGMARAGLFAACVLIELGLATTGPVAIKMVRARRGKGAVESRAQEAFIDDYAKLVSENPGPRTILKPLKGDGSEQGMDKEKVYPESQQ